MSITTSAWRRTGASKSASSTANIHRCLERNHLNVVAVVVVRIFRVCLHMTRLPPRRASSVASSALLLRSGRLLGTVRNVVRNVELGIICPNNNIILLHQSQEDSFNTRALSDMFM